VQSLQASQHIRVPANIGQPLNENIRQISTAHVNFTFWRAIEHPSCFSACTAGPAREWLIQWRPVSDWRQIQARIRKARTSADPSGQLAALYERTRDAMVAFELAQIHEKTGAHSEAARWYTAAAERFRRAQWKQKAEEALTRLGAPIPVAPAAGSVSETGAEPAARLEPVITELSEAHVPEAAGEPDGIQHESVLELPDEASAVTPIAGAVPGHRRKRRGRRGGRGRHKGPRVAVPAAGAPNPVSVVPPPFEHAVEPQPAPIVRPYVSQEIAERRPREPEPVSSFEPAAAGPSLQTRARAGDPALSSRMAKLESQLRRLLACSLHSVDMAEDAPAGPGVFLITDTDQTCYYYIEACQTLRVGIGNLLRSGRASREGTNLKEKLAEHLGIGEARVGKYLKDNCVVRWLQLDEGAPLLAHFAVAVLRPVANE
jgi:hypothetical protein